MFKRRTFYTTVHDLYRGLSDGTIELHAGHEWTSRRSISYDTSSSRGGRKILHVLPFILQWLISVFGVGIVLALAGGPVLDPDLTVGAVTGAAVVVLGVRLFRLNLLTHQRAMLGFTILNTSGVVVMLRWPRESAAYSMAYVLFGALSVAASIGATREMFSMIVEEYPGIRTLARLIIHSAAALGLIVSVLVFLTYAGSRRWELAVPSVVSEASQSIQIGLAVAVVLGLAFLYHYPLRLSWNSRVSCHFFGLVFLIHVLEPALPESSGVRVGTGVAEAIIYMAWAVMLGRTDAPALGVSLRPADAYLLAQLEQLNKSLLRPSGDTARR